MSSIHSAGRAIALARLAAAAPQGWHTRDRDTGQVQGITALLERRTAILADLQRDDLDAETAERLAGEAEEVRQGIDAHNAAAQRASAARAALLGTDAQVQARPGLAPEQPGQRQADDAPDTRGVAQRVLDHEGFRQYRERGYAGQVAIDVPLSQRALVTSDGASAGAFSNPQRVPEMVTANPDRPLRLADLIDRRPTTDSTVEYVREDTPAGAGDTAREVAEGAVKPEAAFVFTVVTDSVRTIAHWINITRQAADDNAQITGYIQGRLAYGLEYRLDAAILAGDGTAPNLRGILNTSGRGTYTAGAGESAIISIRKGITVAQVGEYFPDAAVMSPATWQRVELDTDGNDAFRMNPNPAGLAQPRVWGLNVVPTTAIADNRVLIGAFRTGATLWEREGVRVLMTDSHASNFTSNILTLLAEMRAALSVWRPKAFVDVTLAAAA